MHLNIAESWKNILQTEFDKSYFKDLTRFINLAYKSDTCYPEKQAIFTAFNACSFEDLQVVIIGQDPYHGEGQANGLCFSVKDGVKHPPSLVNIFKELKADIQKEIPVSGDLSHWSEQGVLLLNATLTVRENTPGSHQNKGWEIFSDAVISKISKEKENVIFLLWGKFAQNKKHLLDLKKHVVLEAPHPSPLGAWRGWFGCKHFSKTNALLEGLEKPTINW
ncbi:MAG: uracil-DNA glycosylase [Polaribacter sp.]|nr:uracil-DNA glycosylase [Polaribacter sp.]MDG1812186.1 uracil-DNA glycosylase [Polaribacter sp.]MDG1993691.1 uracil-DNA glycosylase [Polaribacter sp.]